jgi:hypothetical protein
VVHRGSWRLLSRLRPRLRSRLRSRLLPDLFSLGATLHHCTGVPHPRGVALRGEGALHRGCTHVYGETLGTVGLVGLLSLGFLMI